MPRNFDELRAAQDLEFTIGGETFSMHLLPLKMIDVWTKREADVKTDDTEAFTQMCIDRIADAVEDGNGAGGRWRELCKSDNGPSYGELLALARWAWEAQSDLPTMEPEPSQPGPGKTVVSSKGA